MVDSPIPFEEIINKTQKNGSKNPDIELKMRLQYLDSTFNLM